MKCENCKIGIYEASDMEAKGAYYFFEKNQYDNKKELIYKIKKGYDGYSIFNYCPDCGNKNDFDELTKKQEGDA